MMSMVEVHLESFFDPASSHVERDVLVGRAWFNQRSGRAPVTTTFSYDPSYLRREGAWSIDPAFDLATGRGYAEGLPGVFADAAPDRWGRYVIAREAQLDAREGVDSTSPRPVQLTSVDYLLGVSDLTREGALRFRDVATGEWLSGGTDVPPMFGLSELRAAAMEVAAGEAGLSAVKRLLAAGTSSLGGARPKASVRDGDRLCIAKFSHPGDDWHVMAWENVALDVAKASGAIVPAAKLVAIGEDHALVTERFDRVDANVHGPRIPYMSALTLVEGVDGRPYDYADVAERMLFACARPKESIAELVRRIALVIALNDTDDHLRNLGFLRDYDGWKLAPVFDCNPDPRLGVVRQTTVLGAEGDESARALRDFASGFGVGRDECSEIVGRVVRAAAKWETFACRHGIGERERREFAPVFRRQREELLTAFLL